MNILSYSSVVSLDRSCSWYPFEFVYHSRLIVFTCAFQEKNMFFYAFNMCSRARWKTKETVNVVRRKTGELGLVFIVDALKTLTLVFLVCIVHIRNGPICLEVPHQWHKCGDEHRNRGKRTFSHV